jgi:NADPH:quinone reductase-like Zn-dependent oxidoreductase
MEIAYERFTTADGVRLVETDLPEIGSGDVLMRVHRTTVRTHASPILRGAAYLAALKGDPWRPHL